MRELRREELALPATASFQETIDHLLDHAAHLLTDTTQDYIEKSVSFHEQRAKRSRRLRTIVQSTFAALLTLMVVGGIYLRRSTTAAQGSYLR